MQLWHQYVKVGGYTIKNITFKRQSTFLIIEGFMYPGPQILQIKDSLCSTHFLGAVPWEFLRITVMFISFAICICK